MSTLMSGDMNLTRPSTRVRVAPGGASTITFGDPSTTTVRTTPAPTTSPAVIAPTPEGDVIASMKKMNIMTVSSSTKLVGIALATSVCPEEVTTAIGKALAAKGVTNVVVSLVESILILPYLVKEMTQKCDTVLAVAVIEEDGQPMADLIAQTIFEIGLAQNCPVVSATMSPSNVLELKAMLPAKARSWANSIVSLLALDLVAPISISTLETPEVADQALIPEMLCPKPPTPSSRRAPPGGATTIILG